MKVLLTGATGFLGGTLLEKLRADPRVERIDLVSRSLRTHPDPKIRVFTADLSDPSCGNLLEPDVDCVVHCAGLYDLTAPLLDCYNHNVLGTIHLLSKLKEWNSRRKIPIHFASTYSVGFGSPEAVAEKPMEKLPSRNTPYPFTKAVAERAVTDSELPGNVFRFGILVGDSQTGRIFRTDGPYTIMRALHALSLTPARRLPWFPIPGRRYGILPLVPVDSAANVLHAALFRENEKMRIYGVYNSSSVLARDLAAAMTAEFLPRTTPQFLNTAPAPLLQLQSFLLGVPMAVFRFALEPVDLGNPAFVRDFPELAIPAFHGYEGVFFSGFRKFLEEKSR